MAKKKASAKKPARGKKPAKKRSLKLGSRHRLVWTPHRCRSTFENASRSSRASGRRRPRTEADDTLERFEDALETLEDICHPAMTVPI